MNVDLVPFEVIRVGKTLLTQVTYVFGRNRGLWHGDRNSLHLLNNLTVLHHVTNNDLLRLLLRLLRNLLLNLSGRLHLGLLVNDRLLRLRLLLLKKKEMKLE